MTHRIDDRYAEVEADARESERTAPEDDTEPCSEREARAAYYAAIDEMYREQGVQVHEWIVQRWRN